MPRALNQRNIRVHLQPIEYYFGGSDSEVANVEVSRKLGECALDTGSEIEERRILVADFTTQNKERPWIMKKRNPRAARQDNARQWIRAAVCGGSPQGEGRADVGA